MNTLKEYIEFYDNVYIPLYDDGLKPFGVKQLTRPTEDRISQATFGLLYVLKRIGQIVTKEEITKEYVKLTGNHTNDFQSLRHLGTQHGYDIVNNRGGIDGYRLNSMNVKPGYITNRRAIQFDDTEWESIKKEYDNRCATCGDTDGEPTRYDKTKICKLQIGHMNPTKPLTLDNTIPQCEECNTQYTDKFIFNKYGRVVGINK